MLARRALVLLAILLPLGDVTSSCARQASSTSLTAQDHIDIQQLYAAYNNAFDEGNGEAYAQLFTPDGMFNDLAGRDALVAFVKAPARLDTTSLEQQSHNHEQHRKARLAQCISSSSTSPCNRQRWSWQRGT
jgi:hypothetical protein